MPPTSAPSDAQTKTDQIRAHTLSAIRDHMPIKSLFRPELNIDLGTFIKDQMLFHRIALLISGLAQRPATAESVAEHFAGSELLAEIKGMFSKSDIYLPLFYQSSADALNNQNTASLLERSIEGRIFTLKNALIAQHEPQLIINKQTIQCRKRLILKRRGLHLSKNRFKCT